MFKYYKCVKLHLENIQFILNGHFLIQTIISSGERNNHIVYQSLERRNSNKVLWVDQNYIYIYRYNLHHRH